MDTYDLKKEIELTEDLICKILNQFNQKTGFNVSDINLRTVDLGSKCGEQVRMVKIKIVK